MIEKKDQIALKLEKKDKAMIQNFNNITDYLKNHKDKEVYSLTPYTNFRLIHEVLNNKNIVIKENRHNELNPLKLIEQIIMQYDKMFEERIKRVDKCSVVYFDFDDDISDDLLRSGWCKRAINLQIIQFNSEMYKNLFVVPEKINRVEWYNFITEMLKSLFNLSEIQAIELETILLNNYPLEKLISQGINIEETLALSETIRDIYSALIYHLTQQLSFHTHYQKIKHVELEFDSLDQVKEKIYIIKFPITIPTFLKRVISSLFLIRFVVKNYLIRKLERKLVFILNNPMSNLPQGLLNYNSFPLINSLVKKQKEKLRFILYGVREEMLEEIDKVDNVFFEFVFKTIVKFTCPAYSNLKNCEATKYYYNIETRSLKDNKVKLTELPFLFNLEI